MAANLRFGTDADLDGLWEVFRVGFGAHERDRAMWTSELVAARAAIIDGPRGEIAAASHIRPFAQWFGGRPVPLAGYSPVAVLPEHRGKGLGRAVTVGQYADARERGEVIAGLYPAALSLYRAVGFECAGSYVARRFPAQELQSISPDRAVEVRRGTVDDVGAVHRCYAATAPGRDGTLARDERWWARSLPTDLAETMLYVVDDPDHPGELAGYSIHRFGPGRRPYDHSVAVTEVRADDPDVVKALWRVVASSGAQAPDLDVVGPAEDDLFLLADRASPLAVRNEIRWMLRLIDLPGAFAARGWPAHATARIELHVQDQQAPWNDGNWTIEIADGAATAAPGGAGTVEATIGGLSSWWSGYASATRLARLGHLRSADPAALTAMDGVLPAVPPVLTDFY